MGLWKGRSKRKETGGRYKSARKKRAKECGKDLAYTHLSSKIKKRVKRLCGGRTSTGLLTVTHANLNIKGKAKKAEILNVVENKASRHFVRQRIITKGAVIKTSEGLARVTSRPTKDAVVNAVLIGK